MIFVRYWKAAIILNQRAQLIVVLFFVILRVILRAHLIEDCGLKGIEHGGAHVSEKHANFIINERPGNFR